MHGHLNVKSDPIGRAVQGRLPAGIVGLNPAGDINVCCGC